MLALLLALCATAEDIPPTEPTWNQLRATEAEASSFLQTNWNKFNENYHPSYVLDGNPATTWTEGAEGDGLGSWIQWHTSRVRDTHQVKLRIRNGYQKSKGLLRANSTPTLVTIQLLDHEHEVHSATVPLKRAMGWQDVVLDPTEDITFDTVRLTVSEAKSGKSYADTCISDVEVYVDSEASYNQVVENAKHVVLTNWISERKQAAEYYANRPDNYPFASAQFNDTKEELDQDTWSAFVAKIAQDRIDHQALFSSESPWYRAESKGTLKLPEGAPEIKHLDRYISPSLSFFETQEEWRVKTDRDAIPEPWISERFESNLKIQFTDASEEQVRTPVRAVYQTSETYEERMTWTEEASWLIDFDGQGRPVRFVKMVEQEEPSDCWRYLYTHVTNVTWTDNKVSDLTRMFSGQCLEGTEEAVEEGSRHEPARYHYTAVQQQAKLEQQ